MVKPSGGIPRVMTQKEAKKILESHGWTATIGGKHQVKMEKPGERPVTLPQCKGQSYGPGLTHAILKQAGIIGGGSEHHE